MNLNPHISVDCVVFGFDYKELKILLIERKVFTVEKKLLRRDYKLPGDLIDESELLDKAAYRILKDHTGLDSIYLKKFDVFDDLDRMKDPIDLFWLESTTGLKIERVITVAYYALIKLEDSIFSKNKKKFKIRWKNVTDLKSLAFDHKHIVQKSLDHIRKEVKSEQLVFELLPRKFSIRQLQNLYEIILGTHLDNRNFRKKILKLDYIKVMNEKETGVNHKPALLYKFDLKAFMKTERKKHDFIV